MTREPIYGVAPGQAYDATLDLLPSFDLWLLNSWLMDSECCGKCGGALNPFESDLCHDCIENARYNEEQDAFEAWWDEDDDTTAKRPAVQKAGEEACHE